MLLRFQKAAVRGNYEAGNQAFSMRLRFLTIRARTYEEKCTTCLWGCQMAVEMIIDQWNPSKRRYRTETFCYGPRSCPLNRSGPARKVPGRHGMSYTEEDWVDDEATSRRGSDE